MLCGRKMYNAFMFRLLGYIKLCWLTGHDGSANDDDMVCTQNASGDIINISSFFCAIWLYSASLCLFIYRTISVACDIFTGLALLFGHTSIFVFGRFNIEITFRLLPFTKCAPFLDLFSNARPSSSSFVIIGVVIVVTMSSIIVQIFFYIKTIPSDVMNVREAEWRRGYVVWLLNISIDIRSILR